MILLVVVALALVLVPLGGGRLRALADLHFRSSWTLLLALGIQLFLVLVPGEAEPWRVAAHVATFPIGLAFVWRNRDVPGLWVIALGAVLNGMAIVANGGVMPASAWALRTAGLEADPGVFANSAFVEGARLWYLGDVFATPAVWPLANVFSVGDVLVALGAAVTIHAVCGSRLAPRRVNEPAADPTRRAP